MNKIDWLKTFRSLSPFLQIDFILLFLLIFVFLPVGGYLSYKRPKQRKEIAERGIKAIGGKCPVCGGKLKIVDLFTGRAALKRYKIGAARCTKCRHLEIFSEEP